MRTRKLRELLLTQPSRPHRPAHLSAASGLVRVGEHLYVVADDEFHLGVFPIRDAPGTLIRLLPGELPDSRAERKRAKPDFEALLRLAPFGRHAHGALLSLGSGSRPNRRLGALLTLDAWGGALPQPQIFDASALYEAAAREVHELNIEGAVAIGSELILLQRGNKGGAHNALLTFELAPILESIERGGIVAANLLALHSCDLGEVAGVPLCFTDGTLLPGGALLFSAVAEDTTDAYHDGPCGAAAIGIIAANRQQRILQHLDMPLKIEGVHAQRDSNTVDVWMVTDADDPAVPAQLHAATLQLHPGD